MSGEIGENLERSTRSPEEVAEISPGMDAKSFQISKITNMQQFSISIFQVTLITEQKSLPYPTVVKVVST
jgi:hypothetical protein